MTLIPLMEIIYVKLSSFSRTAITIFGSFPERSYKGMVS
jgi:hypothetical protein